MANKKYQSPRVLTAVMQYTALRNDFPHSTGKLQGHDGFVWCCAVHPSEISDLYVIRIEYKETDLIPKVFVQSPSNLRLYEGEKKLPHIYDQEKQQLCLNYLGEWDSTRSISRCYVPWACEWLYYYEHWASTGEWLGGGIHNGVLTEPLTI